MEVRKSILNTVSDRLVLTWAFITTAFVSLSFLQSACGEIDATDENAVQMATNIHLESGLSAEDINFLNVFVFEPRLTDNKSVNCTALLTPLISSADLRLIKLAETQLLPGSTVSLQKIKAGKHRIFFVEALDVSKILMGMGCEENIEIKAGKTTQVDLIVFRRSDQ